MKTDGSTSTSQWQGGRATDRQKEAYWHLAETEAMNVGLSNAYLTKQGLMSLRTLWTRIYPARKRCFSVAVTI